MPTERTATSLLASIAARDQLLDIMREYDEDEDEDEEKTASHEETNDGKRPSASEPKNDHLSEVDEDEEDEDEEDDEEEDNPPPPTSAPSEKDEDEDTITKSESAASDSADPPQKRRRLENEEAEEPHRPPDVETRPQQDNPPLASAPLNIPLPPQPHPSLFQTRDTATIPIPLLNFPLAGPFVNGLLTNDKSIMDSFDSEAALHESTSKILYLATTNEESTTTTTTAGSSTAASELFSDDEDESIPHQVTLPLSEVESIAAEFLQDKKQAVQHAVQLSFLEMKKNHDAILKSIIEYYRNVVTEDLQKGDDNLRTTQTRHEDKIRKLKREYETTLDKMREGYEEELSTFREDLDRERKGHRRALDQYVKASCSAFRMLRKSNRCVD